jgi:hypothetical protein
MSVIARAAAVWCLALACAMAGVASASDGVIEIHPACVATGCGSGDFPGLPVTLGDGTSGRLTADLSVAGVDDSAIQLGNGATLDLGGFALRGPVACTGAPAACNASGGGDGVFAYGSATIRNGTISGFGDRGIYAQTDGVRVENVVVSQNGGEGIAMQGAGHQIVGCRALRNGGDGFFFAVSNVNAVLILRSTAYGNGGDGLDAIGALVLDFAAHTNGGLGIRTDYGSHRSAVGRSVAGNNNGSAAAVQADIGLALGANVCGAAACP